MANQENQAPLQNETPNNQRFQTDAQKLAARHMADPDHVITDEDLANIKVGVTPPNPDAPTRQAVAESDEKIADRKVDSEDDTIPGAQKSTPWDVIK